MKKITFLLLIFCSLNAIGQKKLKIKIDNPEPRVGQSVTFSINAGFLTDYFKNELGNDVKFNRPTSIFERQSDDFKRIIIFKKAKKYEIGPFDFEFNGKKYTTEKIQVNVLPKLPMENGLWLRKIESEGQQYLILEQLINNESNISGIKFEKKELAELKENLADGIALSNYSSSLNNLKPEGAGHLDISFSYSIKKYKIKYENNFNGEYLISEKDIKNLPESFEIGKIKLEK